MGRLNYYRISCYTPYEYPDYIIMAHKDRFTSSELSVMVYDVIDDYVSKYAKKDSYDGKQQMPCDINVFNFFEKGLLIYGLHLKYDFIKCSIVGEASVESGYLLRDNEFQSPFLHKRYKDLEIGQCKKCKRREHIAFDKYECLVKNKRRDVI